MFIMCLLAGMCISLPAQTISRSVIGSTGGLHPQMSYSVGESIIQTGSNPTITLTQGFQQPDELLGTFTDPFLGTLDFRLYPSPTLGDLVLEVDSDQPMHLEVVFSDMRGRQVGPSVNWQVHGVSQRQLDVRHFAAGTYSLALRLEEGPVIRTIRFQKTD